MINFMLWTLFISAPTLILIWVFNDIYKKIRKIGLYEVNSIKKGKICIKDSLFKSGLPFVTIIIGGQPCNFLIDTGATSNIISRSLIPDNIPDECRFKAEGSIITAGNDDPNQELSGVRLDFSLNNKTYREDFIIMPLQGQSDQLFKECGMPLYGILGSSFFQKNKWEIDFEEEVIWCSK